MEKAQKKHRSAASAAAGAGVGEIVGDASAAAADAAADTGAGGAAGAGGAGAGVGTLTATRIAGLVEEAVVSLACTLRADYRKALEAAVACESNERGRKVLGQLLENARLAAAEQLPICQDTGYVWVLLEVGGALYVPADIFSGVNAAVARAYTEAGLRKSMLRDALLERVNTGDNAPAFCELRFVEEAGAKVAAAGAAATAGAAAGAAATAAAGAATVASAKNTAVLHIMLKGGGSDNASRLVMLAPGAGEAGVREVVLATLREKAANACPPLVVGVGVGSTFDKVAGLAKRALLRPIGTANPSTRLQTLEQDWLAQINALGIGPGGFGGDTTALAVHIQTAPCHIAALPVAVNIGCGALRSVSINLLAKEGSSPAAGDEPPHAAPAPAPAPAP
ncbi:MAG: fumarate hydratase, partial [Coriobacteriales bacterium]|nr:fumarate hydratase [Coriobacteriales bacterium]